MSFERKHIIVHGSSTRIDVTRDELERYIKKYVPEHVLEGTEDVPEPDRVIWTPAHLILKAKTVGFVTVAFLFTCFLTFTILFAVNGAYNLRFFTLWSFTLHDVYYFTLCLALLFEHWILSAAVLLLVPLANGSGVFVAYAIVIIIGVDASVYLKDTIFGLPPGKITIEQLHTGDWVEHAFPPFADLLSNFVLAVFVYYIFNKLLNRMTDFWQWVYFFYFTFGSLIFLGIYQLFAWAANIDLLEQYQIPFSIWESILLAVCLNVGYMLFLWFVFRAKQDPKQVHIYLFRTHKEQLQKKDDMETLLSAGPPDELEV